MKQDVHFKKTIQFKHYGHSLQFHVAQDLFSSHQIDVGSRFLLRTLSQTPAITFQKALDLGCGYGPLGLTLKAMHPQQEKEPSVVHMTDRDALAVTYSQKNAVLNDLSNVKVYSSLGFDDIQAHDFDLIVSNIPGKAGKSVISSLLLDAVHFLKPGGLVAIVIVSPLAPLVEEILQTPSIEPSLRDSRSGYNVFHYRFREDAVDRSTPYRNALQRGIYNRDDVTIRYNDLAFPMQTVYGLPEFDTLSYRSQFLLQALQDHAALTPKHVALFNPGQGHAAVALWTLFHPDTITLCDRDLLSLRGTHRNLIRNGCQEDRIILSHQTDFLTDDHGRYDLILGTLREEEGPEGCALTVKQATQHLAPKGRLMLASGSTAATRLTDYVTKQKLLTVRKRKRNKGKSLLILGHRET